MMKEENKVLREAVEQTMKDYYDLQKKFSNTQQNNGKKVNLATCMNYKRKRMR